MRIEIRNGRIVDSANGVDRTGTLYCSHGKIAALDSAPANWKARAGT